MDALENRSARPVAEGARRRKDRGGRCRAGWRRRSRPWPASVCVVRGAWCSSQAERSPLRSISVCARASSAGSCVRRSTSPQWDEGITPARVPFHAEHLSTQEGRAARQCIELRRGCARNLGVYSYRHPVALTSCGFQAHCDVLKRKRFGLGDYCRRLRSESFTVLLL